MLNIQLTDQEKQYLLLQLNNKERVKQEVALRSPWYFNTEYVFTQDEHDKLHPFKKFPAYPYLNNITQLWIDNPLIIIAKSRQMFITWLMASLHLWYALTPGRLIFLQSKKEEDANAILDRIKFIYKRLPRRIKYGMCEPKDLDMNKDPKEKDVFCELAFPWIDSKIRAVPQGPDVLRSHTASAIFSDELAFQDQAKKAYEAAKPTIDGGGKFTAVTTPNGQEFAYNLLFDIERD